MHFLLMFQEVRPISKTRNQLLRFLMSFMTIVTHKSDNTISEKAEASFEESDP